MGPSANLDPGVRKSTTIPFYPMPMKRLVSLVESLARRDCELKWCQSEISLNQGICWKFTSFGSLNLSSPMQRKPPHETATDIHWLFQELLEAKAAVFHIFISQPK